ncbi:MAG: T9SS type A sorting domain-containing protein, partial [Melioribacteraceae bacterium]|nr:T9SS type A sorting domain-containing protein [Melioribacteraceae bacterium]
NYPNPFNPSTKINFDVKEESNVKLVVFNIFGQVIATLVDEVMDQGAYRVEFDATNLPTGVYLYRIEMGNYHQTMKMILTK